MTGRAYLSGHVSGDRRVSRRLVAEIIGPDIGSHADIEGWASEFGHIQSVTPTEYGWVVTLRSVFGEEDGSR